MTGTRALSRLEDVLRTYTTAAAREKIELVERLARATLARPAHVTRLHEALAFLHAYPDDADVFGAVTRALGRFGGRPDVRRFRRALADTGIAGTDIYYRFAARTAHWLAERWPEQLFVDWDEPGDVAELERRLHLLVLAAESPGFDEPPLPFRPWLDRLRGDETDATFLIRRCAAQPLPRALGDRFYDSIGLMIRLAPGDDTPRRGGARFSGAALAPRTDPLRTDRPDLRQEAERSPLRVRAASMREADELVDLAREAMVTRSRDLYTFQAADPRDVRLVECGDGLELACIGVVPEQRLLVEAVYGWLLLRNGVPIGYALTSALWRSAEVAYNVFDTFRGAETAWIYGRLLAAVRQLFAVDTFTVFPYQLGHGNDEGIESGAWWFYDKLGFRPRDPGVRLLADRERRRVERRRSHRSSAATLSRLSSRNVFLDLGERRQDVIGVVPIDGVGLAVSRLMASRFGSDRERAEQTCADEAADLLWAGNWRRLPEGERLAWLRWAPIVVLLPGVRQWSPDERRDLAEVIRAKGGRRESDFVERFDRHRRLRTALRSLARTSAPRAAP